MRTKGEGKKRVSEGLRRIWSFYKIEPEDAKKICEETGLTVDCLEGQLASGKQVDQIIRDNKYNYHPTFDKDGRLIQKYEYPLQGTCVYSNDSSFGYAFW